MADPPWWRGAVVYQIYLRSFCDADGDGQGDLAGVVAKLDYLQRLGVEALWLSPIHPSPNRDWGYDVSAYDEVHPDYGTLAAFDRLLAEAHRRGLKIVLDEVLCHTSDEHPWFKDSMKRGPCADWYVWADPKSDGTAPNNWLSVFGGPAWSYQPTRRQYYHHKFLRQQPRLNWRHPAVREAAARVLRFWLARGVDGFRLDVANVYLHDAALRDNPPVPAAARTAQHWSHASYLQTNIFDANLPENVEALRFIRETVESYPARFVFGEFSEDSEQAGSFLPPDEGVHSGYTFRLLRLDELTPAAIREFYAAFAGYPGYWPSIGFSNHDVPRALTRLFGAQAGPAQAKLILALMLALKGTVLFYQGDELGLCEAVLRRHALKDPVGDLYYPYDGGRDGCRTPMPWDGDAPQLGFTTGTPWLPIYASHRAAAAAQQERDPDSVFAFARQAVAARRASAALRLGEIRFVEAPDGVLVFERRHVGARVACLFNLSVTPATVAVPVGRMLLACGEVTRGAALTLGPFAALLGEAV